jgi:tight adherence protein B
MARVRIAVTFLAGTSATLALARAARRFAIADRLRPVGASPRSRRLPAPLERRVSRALDDAALDIAPAQACSTWALACLVACILGAALGGTSLAVAAVVSAGIGAPVLVHSMRHRRARRIAASVPDVLDRIGAGLRAGGTIASAVADVAAGESPLAADFARVELRGRIGASPEDALSAWARERPAPGVGAAAGALALCATVGGWAADALEGLSSSLRDRIAVAAEAEALSAQARMSALVIGGVPFAYLGWSALVDPAGLATITGTAAGRACFALGALLEMLGLWWMRRIVGSARNT